MTYFPTEVFTHILSYCDTTVKDKLNRVIADITFMNNEENKALYSNNHIEWYYDSNDDVAWWSHLERCFGEELMNIVDPAIVANHWYHRRGCWDKRDRTVESTLIRVNDDCFIKKTTTSFYEGVNIINGNLIPNKLENITYENTNVGL